MINDDPSVIAPALAHLKQSFRLGKTLPIQYRKQQLRNMIRGIKELESKFHEAIQKDLGLNLIQSQMVSTNFTLDEVEYTLNNLDKWNKSESTDVPLAVGPGKSYIKPEPLGVGLVVGPWNYPVANSVAYVASAIAAGNCCVVKPSELSPHVSNVIAELFDKYMDKDCYRCIEGQVEVAKAICKQNFDIIIFTGSTDKGKLIAKAAAENLIPCILELGGKSPTVVDRNADLDNAAYRIMQGRYLNCGQTCVACDYLFVHKDVKEQLIQRFKQKLIEFYGEDPSKSKDYSRIVNDFHLQRLKGYLDENHGGKVLVGGQVNAKDRFIAPTLIENPRLNSKLMQDEIFGPILPIYEFEDFDYVVNFIKERPKPLALYYYGSASSDNYKRLKNDTSSGSLALNESVFQVAILQAPFGGVGFSGHGKLHGYNGFKAFSHFKSVFEKGGLNFFPFNVRYPPYTGTRLKTLNMMLGASSLTQGGINKFLGLIVLLVVLAIIIKLVNFGSIAHSVCSLATETVVNNPNKITQ
jgi:aldehyde dehydrogenase (NAD+)